MDILDEIDESIKDKKREWNYTPMREKSETDALIDELLEEFSTESRAMKKKAEPSRPQYDTRPESFERYEYDKRSTPDGYTPKHSAEGGAPEPDVTQMLSKEEVQRQLREEDMKARQAAARDAQAESGNVPEEEDSGDDELFEEDDYYDEDDFRRELSGIDRGDLSGDEKDEFDDYVGGDEERVRIIQPKKKRSIGKLVLRIMYTAVVAAFAIIGIFSSIIFVLEKIDMMPTDSEKQQEALKDDVKDALYPFVVTDIGDFDSAEKIPDEQLRKLALWEIVIHSDNLSHFKDSDSGDIVIPHKQVEYACEKLLGREENIETGDIKYAGLEVGYDKDKKGYVLSGDYNIYSYRPEVTNVSEKDGVYTVYVNYYADLPSWNDEKKQSPLKTEIFTMKKTSDHYRILSAKASQ